MYEEEDDDLPLQYRRLTANLQTGSLDFNRKLAAYLTHNVAVRSALNQAINDSFAQQYPGAQQFAPNANSMFPSPLHTGNLPSGLTHSPQVTPTSPHPYRQNPYPMPGTPGFRTQSPHKRANSSALPFENANNNSQGYPTSPLNNGTPSNFRRMSMPAATGVKPEIKAEASSQIGSASATSSPAMAVKSDLQKKASPPGQMGPPLPQQAQQQQQHQQQHPAMSIFDFQQSNMNPLSMTLPPDTQQLLGASLLPNDPFSNILLGGNHPNSFFNFNDYMSNDYLQTGINSTLAPNAYIPNNSGLVSPSEMDQQNRSSNSLLDFKGVHYAGNLSSDGNTPGENTFDAWINDNWSGENT